jgi:hypothetical protein
MLEVDMPLPPAARLAVNDAGRKELLSLSGQRSIPRGILLRVNIVLGAAEGRANHVLARELSTTLTTVLLWRHRYEGEGLAGLFSDWPRSGRPKQIPAAKEALIVEATMRTGSARCNPLKRSRDGCKPKSQPGYRAAHLEETQAASASRRIVQVQQRSGFCPKGPRHRGPLQ